MVYHLSVFIFVIIFLSLDTEIETPVSDLAGWAKTFVLILIICFSKSELLGRYLENKQAQAKKNATFYHCFSLVFLNRGLMLIVILNSQSPLSN